MVEEVKENLDPNEETAKFLPPTAEPMKMNMMSPMTHLQKSKTDDSSFLDITEKDYEPNNNDDIPSPKIES